MKVYTKDDAGCYGEGALGHQHVRDTLASLIGGTADRELIDSLRKTWPDDCWDEYKALDLLNDHTQEPAYWDLWDGDLMLFADVDRTRG